MPGGKRSDRISQRDLEVLEFIARFGVVPRRAVALWAATARTATIVRESRLRRADLIQVDSGVGESGPLALATNAGLRACGQRELHTARLSLAAANHDAVVATIAAAMERSGAWLLSEREMLVRERAEDERVFSAQLSGARFHRADLLRLDECGEPPEAIEVELSIKGAARLDELLRAWAGVVAEQRLRRVVYCCSPRTHTYVQRAIERTRTEVAVTVEAL